MSTAFIEKIATLTLAAEIIAKLLLAFFRSRFSQNRIKRATIGTTVVAWNHYDTRSNDEFQYMHASPGTAEYYCNKGRSLTARCWVKVLGTDHASDDQLLASSNSGGVSKEELIRAAMFGALFRKSLNIVPTYSRDGCTMEAESVLNILRLILFGSPLPESPDDHCPATRVSRQSPALHDLASG